MNLLITVASKHGATTELAEAALVTGVAGFDAVVLGSAVYAGHWRREATALVDRFADDLAARPVWLFSSGPVGDPPRPEEDPVEVAGLLASTGAVEHRVFAGAIDRRRLGLAERAVVRALKVPDGDFRDFDAVRAWADEIAATLAAPTPA